MAERYFQGIVCLFGFVLGLSPSNGDTHVGSQPSPQRP